MCALSATGVRTNIKVLKQKPALMLILVSLMFLASILACAAEAQLRIMPLGDSITEGAVGSSDDTGYRRSLYLSLTAAGCDADFVGGLAAGIPTDFDRDHEGHSGWQADQIRDNVYDWLDSNPADIVLLHIGTNDITDANEDVAEVNDILNEIDRYSQDITVVLAARIILRNDSRNPQTIAFNDAVEAMAQDRIDNGDDIIIVDMALALTYPDDLVDSVHPNDSGYARMAEAWYDALINDYFAPVITSAPVTNGAVGLLYTYDVNATGYPEPNYTLLEYPTEMTIEPNTGLIEWIPTAANDFNVTVVAGNDTADINQSFTIIITTAIEFDANSSATNGDVSDDTINWSHTIGSGNNRILLVGTVGKDRSDNNLLIDTITYNSIPLIPVAGSAIMVGTGTGNDLRVKTELYYLLDGNLPPAGSYDVNVTYSGNVKRICTGAVSLRNVEQQPAEAVNTNYNENLDTISTNITTLTDGSWLIDVVGCSNQGIFDVNNGNKQIERFDVNSVSSAAAGSTRATASAGPTAMGWTFSYGAERLAHSVAAFAPAKRIISGYILEPNDTPVEGVLVSATPSGISDTTDPNGYYEIMVSYGWSGTVTPTKGGNIFSPPQRFYDIVVVDHLQDDFEDISIYNLEPDDTIDLRDLKVMCEHWLETGLDVPGDLNNDNIVSFPDFADFSLAW